MGCCCSSSNQTVNQQKSSGPPPASGDNDELNKASLSGSIPATQSAVVESVRPVPQSVLRPIFKVPAVDKKGDNDLVSVWFHDTPEMTEVTVVFKDEDRPEAALDVVYDALRAPLFGHKEDVETFQMLKEGEVYTQIRFEGTYAGDQFWGTKAPKHMTITLPFSDFTKDPDSKRPIIWVNTWNHLFGEKNSNVAMEMTTYDKYLERSGSRKHVDKALGLGIITGIKQMSSSTGVAPCNSSAMESARPVPESVLRPVFMVPTVDIVKGNNGIVSVWFSDTIEMTEVTVVFKDEDRPEAALDAVYDAIRAPLFGHKEDVETFQVLKDVSGNYTDIKFEGTYSGDQSWNTKAPTHMNKTLPLTDFTKYETSNRPIVWVNTWNHLFGEKNTNESMDMTTCDKYPERNGSRKNADKSLGLGIVTGIKQLSARSTSVK